MTHFFDYYVITNVLLLYAVFASCFFVDCVYCHLFCLCVPLGREEQL